MKAFSAPHVNKTSWFKARDYCIASGGELLSIHSATDLHALQQNHQSDFLYKEYWIGYGVSDPGLGYAWTDGSPVSKLSTCIELFIGHG